MSAVDFMCVLFTRVSEATTEKPRIRREITAIHESEGTLHEGEGNKFALRGRGGQTCNKRKRGTNLFGESVSESHESVDCVEMSSL